MNLFPQINLLKRMHYHIDHKSTGTPTQFADKLQISKRTLFWILEELKGEDVHMVYDRSRESYTYIDENTIALLFEAKEVG